MAEVKDKLLTAESLKYVYDSLSDDISKIKSEIDGGTSNDVTARAGQTVIVKEVDTNSNPTKWEAVEYQPRTHWAEYTELLPLTEVAPQLNENLGMAMSFLPICELIEGNWYKVTFDGVEYICQASFVSMADENGIAIGNKVLAGGADTGEPFGYVYMIEGYNPDGGYTTYDYNILYQAFDCIVDSIDVATLRQLENQIVQLVQNTDKKVDRVYATSLENEELDSNNLAIYIAHDSSVFDIGYACNQTNKYM